MPSHVENYQGAALDQPVRKSRRMAITSVVTVSLMPDLTDDGDKVHTWKG